MLNYIWLGLVVVGILVAAGTDWHDLSLNRYHNGETVAVSLVPDVPAASLEPGKPLAAFIMVPPSGEIPVHDSLRQMPMRTGQVRQKAVLIPSGSGTAAIRIMLDASAPSLWNDIRQTQKNSGYLLGSITSLRIENGIILGNLGFEKVAFTHLNAVTNDGIIGSARTAVELAIGLIGIMALWLGLMKIAEASGLAATFARMLRPVMRRLFPDIPPDHPAMGAMVMNISANMLGLANAATPLGLKAMEELNRLNPKAGTATDAMCTFLVINTSNVQLIPATVIAIRAASGSANPAEILGPVIIATAVSLVVGVTVVKLLGKMKVYKEQGA